MAGITGIFTADFKSFYDAVAQARVKLKDFQSDAEAVAQKVDKVANAFSGRKLVQDAEIMTKAITEIGGATALTAKEQAQVNAKLTEAIEKYRVLGQVAPQNMHDLEKATRQVNTETAKTSTGIKDIGGSLLKMASAVGIAFSAEAVLGFVKSVFESATQINDLSQKIGISTTAVQQFKYAAEQSGASLDDVGTAIAKMNEKLASGDKSTVHALTDVGLKLNDLRAMSPEQAFLAITDALEKTTNPMERARLEMELLGKAGGALSAAITSGFSSVAKDATVMADDTIQALAEAQQAWENLANRVVIATGTMIGETAKAVQQMTTSWRGFAAFLGTMMTSGVGAAMTQASLTQTGMNAAGGRGDVNLPGPARAGAAELERLAQARAKLAREAQAAADKQQAADERIFAGMRQFTSELEKRDTALRRSTLAVLDWVKEHRVAKEVISATLPAEVTRQWTDWDARVKDNVATLKLWGKVAGEDLNAKAAAAARILKIAKANLDEWRTGVMEAIATTRDWAEQLDRSARAVGSLFEVFGKQVPETMNRFIESFSQARVAMDGFMRGMRGDLSGWVEGVVASIKSVKAWWQGLMGLFGGTKGRDLVVNFAESLGGFDALQKQLEALGEEGARLWVKLTQGTDRGNPDQAKKNIEEVEEALRKHKEATGDVTEATEEQARATIETASEAERAMKALEPLLKANEDSWRAWGDVVNGQIDRVASALRSLALPNLSGAAVAQSAPNTSSGGGTAVINLDSRQIAEAVVPRIPGVVRRYGLA